HESRHLEKNILSGIDTLILKKPAPLQIGLDRSFLKPYLLEAQKAFKGKNEAACKSLSYVCFSPSGFEGTLENRKATFWTEELSHIFASGHQGRIEVPAKELSREEKKKRAQKLHDFYHHSYGDISKELGAAKTTVYRWVNENNEGGTS
ncbi:helix-turn-helix domain-containing protein, partial [Candidatus Aerophobetes bacterium]|nr:helix-turn-helix domain-containing protein [Candidatus Aerophobetes bacterium]